MTTRFSIVRGALVALALLVTLALALPAQAGRLGAVVKGVKARTSSGGSRGRAASPKSSRPPATPRPRRRVESNRRFERDDPRVARRPRMRTGYGAPCGTCTVGGPVVTRDVGGPPPGAPQAGLDVYLGAQSLVESDAAGSVSLRGHVAWLGLEVANTSFVESVDKGTERDFLTLHAWNASMMLRLVRPATRAVRAPEVTATFGFAGLRTLDVELIGAQVGLDGRLPLNETLSLLGEVDGFVFDDGVRSFNTRLAIGFGRVQLGYRITQFNTGPALHGPELGLSWHL